LTVPLNAPTYAVVTAAHFDRLLKKLVPKHPDLVERFEEALGILSLDPHNKSHKYPIKKLKEVSAGDGQYRLRSGRFRFRYDIAEHDVVLLYCGLRREDTY
jgi:mRNA-degrading endonuclease RelE of RelBE toxin-antitoxin system